MTALCSTFPPARSSRATPRCRSRRWQPEPWRRSIRVSSTQRPAARRLSHGPARSALCQPDHNHPALRPGKPARRSKRRRRQYPLVRYGGSALDAAETRWRSTGAIRPSRRAPTTSPISSPAPWWCPTISRCEGFAPTTISSLKAADPGNKINLIGAPQVNSNGDAKLSYPVELPAGRSGHQPPLAIAYDSSRGNGWLGTGWGLDVPSIDIDTRWGVPRYDTGQIPGRPPAASRPRPICSTARSLPRSPTAARSSRARRHLRTRRIAWRHARASRCGSKASSSKIVRHGSSPQHILVGSHRQGRHALPLRRLAGNRHVDRQAVLSDPASPNGNIGRWMLREVIDPNGNNITLPLRRGHRPLNGPEPARQIYPNSINYTGRSGGADGSYQVVFTRDHVRTDPIVDGRPRLQDGDHGPPHQDRREPVDGGQSAHPPATQLDYITGQFNKSLLQKITQFGRDGAEFNHHSFDYFDEVGSPSGVTIFGGDVAVPGAGTTAGSDLLVAGVDGTAVLRRGQCLAPDPSLYRRRHRPSRRSFPAAPSSAPTPTIPSCRDLLIDLNGDGRVDQVMRERRRRALAAEHRHS